MPHFGCGHRLEVWAGYFGPASFDTAKLSLGEAVSLVRAEPPLADGALTNGEALKDQIALVHRGGW